MRRSIVVANSAKLRFRLTAKTAHASLLLLSQSGPAVVDPLWVPFVGPRAAAHKRGKRNPRQTAGISAKSKNYSSMSITTLFPRCGQSHESFAFAGTLLIEMLRAAKPPFRQGFVLRTKRLYAPFGAPHRRRKVRLSPFPPDGENCARSLAPPLPTRPAAAGLGRGTPLLGPRGLFHGREAKAKRAPNGGPPRKFAVKAQFPARAAVMMAME